MKTLIAYELKKILGNRAGLVACFLALAFVVAVALMNVLSVQIRDVRTGEIVSGTGALEALRVMEEQRAGTLTDERVADDLATLERAQTLAATTEGFSEMSQQDVINSYGIEFWQDTYGVITDAYYARLLLVMDTDDNAPSLTSLEEGISANLESTLSRGYLLGTFGYSDAEKELWRSRASEVEYPLIWGYAQGWMELYSWSEWAGLIIIAACIALSGVFAGEYQAKTAAVILPTRRGKGSLGAAKAVASFTFATVFYVLCVACGAAVFFAFEGIDGANLPAQVQAFGYPYALTIAQAVLGRFAILYLMLLGASGFTLLLSSRIKSTMPVAVIPVVAVFMGLVLSFFEPATKATAWLPLNALSRMGSMLSYGIGSIAFDLPTLVVALYAVLLVAGTAIALRSFRSHQVS